MKFESIKVETDRIIKVRNRVKETRQTISGFIALAIDEKLQRENIPFFGEGVSNIGKGPAVIGEVGIELINLYEKSKPTNQ